MVETSPQNHLSEYLYYLGKVGRFLLNDFISEHIQALENMHAETIKSINTHYTQLRITKRGKKTRLSSIHDSLGGKT